MLAIFFYTLFVLRFFTIFISAATEKRLKKIGAAEFGAVNSKFLVAAHFAFYAAALTEGYKTGAFFGGAVTIAGTVIYAFSIFILYYVIHAIRHVWTVKLLVVSGPAHYINKSWLFRTIRHPNYYLNIIPELIAVTLVFHAWTTLMTGLPLYLIPLIIRIRLEEKIMRKHFKNYI